MAVITNVLEFEATMDQAVIVIVKWLHANGQIPKLREARRAFEKINNLAKDPEKLKANLQLLQDSAQVVRELIPDEKLHDDLWDCIDYIEIRC